MKPSREPHVVIRQLVFEAPCSPLFNIQSYNFVTGAEGQRRWPRVQRYKQLCAVYYQEGHGSRQCLQWNGQVITITNLLNNRCLLNSWDITGWGVMIVLGDGQSIADGHVTLTHYETQKYMAPMKLYASYVTITPDRIVPRCNHYRQTNRPSQFRQFSKLTVRVSIS